MGPACGLSDGGLELRRTALGIRQEDRARAERTGEGQTPRLSGRGDQPSARCFIRTKFSLRTAASASVPRGAPDGPTTLASVPDLESIAVTLTKTPWATNST